MYNNIVTPGFFSLPTPVYLASGITQTAGNRLKEFGCKKVLILYDTGVEGAGIAGVVIDAIKREGIDVVAFNKVKADPPDYLVDEAAKVARDENVDGLVAVGGGSAIDTAKAVKILLCNKKENIKDFLLGKVERVQANETLPFLKIPTTAGTGSEITLGLVITYTGENKNEYKKITLFGFRTCANEIALIDPELMVGCPPHITAACGFDVLAHAISGSLSSATNRLTQSVGMQALRLVRKSLKAACDNGSNLDARSDIATACALAGMTIGNGMVVADHVFAHALSAIYPVPHGAACAIFTPVNLEFFANTMPDEIMMISEIFSVSDADAVVAAKRTGEAVYQLSRSVKLPNIKEIEPDKGKMYRIVELAMADEALLFTIPKVDEKVGHWFVDRAYEYAAMP